jgi:hypothetical protein
LTFSAADRRFDALRGLVRRHRRLLAAFVAVPAARRMEILSDVLRSIERMKTARAALPICRTNENARAAILGVVGILIGWARP